jgi:hypothetical protein
MPTRSAPKGRTKITPLRLAPDTLAEVAALGRRWGLTSTAAVVRSAVRRAALAEGLTAPDGATGAPKKPGKNPPTEIDRVYTR